MTNQPSLTISQGDGQRVAPVATFGPLAVVFKNASGKPVGNQAVIWSANYPTEMDLEFSPAGEATVITKTNRAGKAVLNKMRGASVLVHAGEGEFTVNAACGDLNAVAHLVAGSLAPTLTAVPGFEASLHFEEVDLPDPFEGAPITVKRSVKIGPLSVVLKTAKGRPMPNQTIHWKVPFPAFPFIHVVYGPNSPADKWVNDHYIAERFDYQYIAITNEDGIATLPELEMLPRGRFEAGQSLPGGDIVINVPVQATWGSIIAMINLAMPFTGINCDTVFGYRQSGGILDPMPK